MRTIPSAWCGCQSIDQLFGVTGSRRHTGTRTAWTAARRDDLLCCQSLFKYLPQYNDVFTRIAAAVPSAQFLHRISPGADRAIPGEAGTAVRRCGIDARRHLLIIPPVHHEQFPALLRIADVYLDSIGWSGGNTTWRRWPNIHSTAQPGKWPLSPSSSCTSSRTILVSSLAGSASLINADTLKQPSLALCDVFDVRLIVRQRMFHPPHRRIPTISLESVNLSR